MLVALITTLFAALPDDGHVWRDQIVYVVIIDKFCDGDPQNNHMKDRFFKDRGRYEGGFWGGDLKGVIDRLDDLADLGVTTLLLYPVMQNDEHPVGKFLATGYRPKDYEHVDRNFGDIALLRLLVDEAHRRGLRVILDMPITLPGFEHPFLSDPTKKDWFGPPSQYGVPRWKAENPKVADYLIGVCKRWKERSGCDGFRIDSAHLQPVAFWKRFVAELKTAPPQGAFVILPELPVNPREIGKLITEAEFDGAYDFSVMRIKDVLGKGESVGLLSFISHEARQFYPSPSSMLAPMDNYEDAFVLTAKEPKAMRTRLALAYLLTIDRVPLLYAGDELGIAFREVGGAFPAERQASPFLKDVKTLIKLRNREQTLRRGDFSEIFAQDLVYAFERRFGEDRILVVLNGSDRQKEFSMPPAGRTWKECRLEDLISGGVVKQAGGGAAVDVKPFDLQILRVN